MRYFEDFFSHNESISQYLKYNSENNKYYCDNIDILNTNRALVNDYVEIYQNKIINIIQRHNHKISGYLDNTIIHGKNEKGKNLFKFIPFNKKYPHFRVVSNIKSKGKYYCYIEFKSWSVNQQYPIGNIIYVDKENNPFNFLLYKYDLKNTKKNISQSLTQKIENDLVTNLNLNSITTNYIGYTVDPIGSNDLDDAIYNIDNTFFVYITNPLPYINQELMNHIQNNITSIYTHNKVINMYPEEYSNTILSLKKNTNKFCKIFIFQYDDDYNLVNIKIEDNYVFISENYNYDEFEIILKEDDNRKGLMEKYNIADSHKYIEYFMIEVNKYIANIIKDNENKVIRTCKDGKGYYSNEYLKHDIIGDYYTHFTSPIRRIIDNYIFLLLDNDCDIDYVIELDKINDKMNKTRKYSYALERLKLIEKLESEYIDNGYIEKIGIIHKIDNKNIIIKIDDYKIKEKISNYHNMDLKVGEIVTLNIVPFFNNLYYKDKLKINIIQ